MTRGFLLLAATPEIARVETVRHADTIVFRVDGQRRFGFWGTRHDRLGAPMIAVDELDRIARARLDDAKSLLAAGRFDGATYVCGYAVEVALKAQICRTLNWSEFPATGGEFAAYKSFRTHELEVLLRLSGREGSIKQNHFALWNAVAVWKADSRYYSIGTAQQAATRSMIQATDELLEAL